MPTFVLDLPGLYFISLTVNDGSLSDTALLTNPAREPGTPPTPGEPDGVIDTEDFGIILPVAVAALGQETTVLVGQENRLDGSGSFDPNDLPLTFLWSVVSAPEGGEGGLFSETDESPIFVPSLAADRRLSDARDDGDVVSRDRAEVRRPGPHLDHPRPPQGPARHGRRSQQAEPHQVNLQYCMYLSYQ